MEQGQGQGPAGHRARRAWIAVTVVGVLLVVAVAAAVWTGNRPPEPPPRAGQPASDTVTFAAVGDSLTKADTNNFPTGEPGPQTWVGHAETDGVEFAGGWAEWGAPTSLMAANARPVDADVLVVLAGTNDLAAGVPFEETAANISSIVAASAPERVIVSAIPPIDTGSALFRPGAARSPDDYNRRLEAYAAKQGWDWTDAAAGLRDGSHFLPGMSYDGVHFTEAGAKVMGEAFRAAILDPR